MLDIGLWTCHIGLKIRSVCLTSDMLIRSFGSKVVEIFKSDLIYYNSTWKDDFITVYRESLLTQTLSMWYKCCISV